MPGRVAIDFGSSNTVMANWDTVRQQGISFSLKELSGTLKVNDDEINVVPSLIHYGTAGQRFYGNEVRRRNLAISGRSFQWMKRYVLMASRTLREIDGRKISDAKAGEQFLSHILNATKHELGLESDEEIALTLPVEAFEYYENWLSAIAAGAGFSRVRFIDEPSAVALGYMTRLFTGECCIVFDFGASALNIAIVRHEELPETSPPVQRCRVLGKAGGGFSGTAIDEWLFGDIILRHGSTINAPEIRQISRLLLSECQALKERLSYQEHSSITVMNPNNAAVVSQEYSRAQLEALIESKNGFSMIDRTLERALSDARANGYRDDLKAVLVVGGSSLMPCVQEKLRSIFGKEKLRTERPLDATARGACAFIAGAAINDHLQHDYAMRIRSADSESFEFRTLVKRGCPFPSEGAVATLNVKAINDGQQDFMMQIFERSDCGTYGRASEPVLSFDEQGNLRFNSPSEDQLEQMSLSWLNEFNPTIIRTEEPARRGEECFEVSFALDEQRRLLVSARDLRNGRLLQQNQPLCQMDLKV